MLTKVLTRATVVCSTVAVVAGGAVGTAAAQTTSAAPWQPATTSTAASGDGCPLLHMVIAQGTTESSEGSMPKDDTGTLAQVILPVLSEFGGGSEGTFDRTYVPYPADYGFQGTPYEQSYRQGVQNTLKVIGDIATSCPKTKVGVMGYSQGGNVASTVLRLIGAGQGSIDPSRVAMGMVFSDPTRTAGSPTFPGRPATQTVPDSVPGTRGQEVAQLAAPAPVGAGGGGIAPLTEGTPPSFGALTGRVASACAAGDIACDTPADAKLARVVTNVSGQLDLDTRDPVGILTSAATVLPTTTLKMASDVVVNDIVTTDGTTRGLDYRPKASLSSRAEDATNPQHQAADPVAALTKLVGIGINSGIALIKDVLTMENIAQIAAVGLVNPAAGLAVLAAKAADAALNLIPANITNKTAKAVETIVRNEAADNAGLVKMATDVRYWAVRANHESYQRDPVTSGGQTWLEFATEWIKAAVQDLQNGSTSGTGSTGFTRPVPVSGQGSSQGLPGLNWESSATPAKATSFDVLSSRSVTPNYTRATTATDWMASPAVSEGTSGNPWDLNSTATAESAPPSAGSNPWDLNSTATAGTTTPSSGSNPWDLKSATTTSAVPSGSN